MQRPAVNSMCQWVLMLHADRQPLDSRPITNPAGIPNPYPRFNRAHAGLLAESATNGNSWQCQICDVKFPAMNFLVHLWSNKHRTKVSSPKSLERPLQWSCTCCFLKSYHCWGLSKGLEQRACPGAVQDEDWRQPLKRKCSSACGFAGFGKELMLLQCLARNGIVAQRVKAKQK